MKKLIEKMGFKKKIPTIKNVYRNALSFVKLDANMTSYLLNNSAMGREKK